MDYPFFIKPISVIPAVLLNDLIQIVKTLNFGKHPHFSDHQQVTTVIGDERFEDQLGLATKALLPFIPMEPTRVTMWEVNLLKAGESIQEHSDISSLDGSQGSKVVKTHKIHIPLQTHPLVRFGHRRSRKLPIEYQHLPAGFAYAYNNYVWHSVDNLSPIDRFQMTIRYTDPDWILRKRLLQSLGVRAFDGYEEPV